MTYNKGSRMEMVVTYKNTYSFMGYMYNAYNTTNNYLHKFEDAEGQVLVWKTQKPMQIEKADGKMNVINRGEVIRIKATIKGESEYKGQNQINLTRCSVLDILIKAPTKEEWEAQKAKELLEGLGEGDKVIRMPYRQYKQHYADCKTVPGSFDERGYIEVVILAGRMVNSGVRGRHFYDFVVEFTDGSDVTYKAVCEENAIRRAEKEFPGLTVKNCEEVAIYRYRY